LSYAVAIAAIIGLVRIRVIDRAYYPFILLLWVALLTEITGTIVIRLYRTNAINSNIYVLLESVLILWFFRRLKLFSKTFFAWLMTIFILAWIAENFIIFSITTFQSYFRVFYSFVIVLLSIHMINKLFSEERRKLIKNPVFLIMITFIVFFTYKTLIEIFYIYGLDASDEFKIQVYRIMPYINLTANLLYAIAVIWIPRKQEYTLL
jgi:hypothetical protein